MLLSKYHGVLIIGFTLLSNPALLKRKSFWMMVALSALFFLPHLHWQIINDFPSFNYHLFERSSKGYSFNYTIEYVFTQPFVLGPLIGLLLIYLGVTFKPRDLFERSLKFLMVGTYIFFFLMTFKGKVEGNWTIITLVPLLYVGYRQIENDTKHEKITYYSFAFSILIILSVRIAVTANFFPSLLALEKSVRASEWSKELKKKSEGRPAAFMNSYQRASLYEFYSGVPAFSLNNVWGRKNQYSLWDTEAKFQGKAIVLVTNYPNTQFDSVRMANESFPYLFIDNFRSASNVIIQSDLPQTVKLKTLDTLRLVMKFNYRNGNVRDFESNADYPSKVIYSFFQHSKSVDMRGTDIILKNEMIGNGKTYSLLITAPSAPGKYDFYLSVGTGWLPAGINSEKIRIIVE